MANPIVIPRLGWNMEGGTFLGWLKPNGAAVRAGEPIFRLESEKATEDVECLDDGILRIGVSGPKEGDRLAVGTVIGHVENADAGERGPPAEKPASAIPVVGLVSPTAAVKKRAPTRNDKSPAISPRARRVAAELGVDWTTLRGSGRTGRIREQDVRRAMPRSVAAGAVPGAADKIVAINSVRRATALHLANSRQATVPVTLTTTAIVTNLLAARAACQVNPSAGPVPSLTDLFVKLAAHALERHPLLAAQWADDRLVLASAINIGIGVDTDAGLLVPVIHNVPSLSVRQLAARSQELIHKARQGTLASSEMQGGVFTITNLGMFGIDAFTPVINHPQCAILGIGRVRRVPVFVDDKVVAQDEITLSLTFDHRIVDGAPAAKFLRTLTQAMENPGPWLSFDKVSS
jgi:pyruvate dehydrogenase E2 component (dihydrolipoamide acetyltransferase)